jgi:REP element-mobilizing transposase RayT
MTPAIWWFEIISYCLMTNHVHLQIQTKDKHVKYLMMRVNRFYAKYFNNMKKVEKLKMRNWFNEHQ